MHLIRLKYLKWPGGMDYEDDGDDERVRPLMPRHGFSVKLFRPRKPTLSEGSHPWSDVFLKKLTFHHIVERFLLLMCLKSCRTLSNFGRAQATEVHQVQAIQQNQRNSTSDGGSGKL